VARRRRHRWGGVLGGVFPPVNMVIANALSMVQKQKRIPAKWTAPADFVITGVLGRFNKQTNADVSEIPESLGIDLEMLFQIPNRVYCVYCCSV